MESYHAPRKDGCASGRAAGRDDQHGRSARTFQERRSGCREQLVERSLPPLKRWARGRLPQWARSLAETQDLVQNAVLRALPHLKTFEAKHPGALQAYLHKAIDNHIKDEI